MDTRIVRRVAVAASAVLLLGAFVAAPADAKKKKKKKKAPVVACAPYAPAEKGKDAPLTLVTDAATAEAPVTTTLATAPGLGSSSEEGEGNQTELGTSHQYVNVQVDSAAPTVGLYIQVSHTPVWDYDLWIRDAMGTAVAYSAGSSPAPTPATDGTGHGGHTETGSENIDGLATSDCGGYTVDVANAGGPGEDVTISFWLGEPGA